MRSFRSLRYGIIFGIGTAIIAIKSGELILGGYRDYQTILMSASIVLFGTFISARCFYSLFSKNGNKGKRGFIYYIFNAVVFGFAAALSVWHIFDILFFKAGNIWHEKMIVFFALVCSAVFSSSLYRLFKPR